MRATCWMGRNHVEVADVPDPRILNQRDAIVRITSTAICGSDLHLVDGYIPTMERGDVLGHEFMGEVVEVGREVRNLVPGDRIVVPFPISCGGCRSCQDGLFSLDLPKTKKAVSGLTHDIMTLQAHGDYAGVKQLFERMVVIRPEVQRVIDKLAMLPVDIAPRFVTAEELVAAK